MKKSLKICTFLLTLFFTSFVVPQYVGLEDGFIKVEAATSTEIHPVVSVVPIAGITLLMEENIKEYLNVNDINLHDMLPVVEENTLIYTEEELLLLSCLIMGESGGASETCQLYVGSVVLNRVNHESFPNTIEEVIFQKGQYACTWDGNFDKEPTEECVENAKYL